MIAEKEEKDEIRQI